MPDSMHVDPAVLRELARQHDEVYEKTMEWSQPPTEYLARFPEMFGTICAPVHQALCDYYDARYRAGKALADENAQTANSLRAAAQALENTDQDLGSLVRNVGEQLDSPASAPVGVAPPGLSTNSFDGVAPAGPPTSVAGASQADAPTGTQAAATVPPTPGTVLPPHTSGDPAGLSAPLVTAGSSDHAPPVLGPAAPVPGNASSSANPLIPGSMDDRAESASASTSPRFDALPLIGPTPFGSAVQAAALREGGTGHVVNDDENPDLILARTLLGGLLAATETSAVGVSWAVSVMRGPAGANVFVTSNEGRGWLPAGLFLPREVSTPWVWDDLLGAEGSPWEGVSDPARVLVEFALVWGPRDDAVLSALASSGPIAAQLRTELGDVATAAAVGPATGVDLRVFTPDTTDRLGIGGSIAALEQIATVSDASMRGRCVDLAQDAHTQLSRSAGRVPEATSAWRLRERILARAEGGFEVPAHWWQELRATDELLVTTMLPHQLDADRIGLGELRVDEQSAVLRQLTFERRCNELVLLLEGEPNRQCLRDAVYAHEQIVGHPRFAATAPVESTTDYVGRAGFSGVVATTQLADTPPPAPVYRLGGESAPS
ncbi:type VII secretion target [Nocardia vulneris]|uniref:type VII secretion target n=1 Tax=Nocardia vulneris TaxID=1141657 RepID=UPI0030D3C872